MPVRIGRVSSREADRATARIVSTNARAGIATVVSPPGSGSGGKSSARSVRRWKLRRAGDELDVLVLGPQLERHLVAGQLADDVEQQPRRQDRFAGARRPRRRAASRRPISMSVARSSTPPSVAAICTPESAWIALRVEATRATVCRCASRAAAEVEIFTMSTSERIQTS